MFWELQRTSISLRFYYTDKAKGHASKGLLVHIRKSADFNQSLSFSRGGIDEIKLKKSGDLKSSITSEDKQIILSLLFNDEKQK